MPELGRAALVVCLGLALYALVAGVYAALTRRRRLARSAQNALLAAFGAAAVATGVLLAALLRSDFSFVYVAEHTSLRAADAVHDLGLLGRPGGLAAALAPRPDGLLGRGGRVRRAERARISSRGSSRCSGS